MEEVTIQYKRILRFKVLLHLQKEDNFDFKKKSFKGYDFNNLS